MDERVKLQQEYEAIAMSGTTTPEANRKARDRMCAIKARLAALDGDARMLAHWQALSDDQRLELMATCCRACGTLALPCYCGPEYDN